MRVVLSRSKLDLSVVRLFLSKDACVLTVDVGSESASESESESELSVAEAWAQLTSVSSIRRCRCVFCGVSSRVDGPGA